MTQEQNFKSYFPDSWIVAEAKTAQWFWEQLLLRAFRNVFQNILR